MIQKNLFQQILEEHHSNNFLREHLAIKEGQHKVRIQNAKKQISKFKQFLTEDREQLKVTKQIQEEQISFQKNNRIIKSQKEININFDKNLMDQNQPDISKQSRQQRREKKSITHFIVNEEQQQIINDKIQKLVEQKVNSNGRKPKVPTQKDMHNQRQDYSNQNIKNPNQSEQFPSQKSINEQSSQSISNQTLTPYDSPLNITPTEKRKSQLIKILAQKMPYKQSLFSENLIFADRNDSCISIQHIDEVQNNKSPEPQTDDRYQSFNRGSMLKKKSHQIKNINDQKIQFASKPIELNQLNLENRRGNYIQNERTQINTETSSQFGLSSLPESPVKYGVPYRMQSQQALFYMNQQQQENISSFNNPDRINPHQQIKSMFEDKSKFVSTFFNKSQIKKLTSSLQKYKESSLNEERMNIKRSILQKKTKNNNYIDYSSDDLKRNLIDQVNILTSPRQQQTSIILGSSCERYKLPKQASQPTLKFIEFSKLEVPEMNTKNKNITMTDFYKKSKQNIDLNNNSQNQMFSLNNINKVQQLRSSINLRLEEESSKLIPLTSSRNNNNQTQKQQLNLQSSLKNLFQNNIHIRKDQNEQNKQQPLKMSIRFQNLFKNHQQQNQ